MNPALPTTIPLYINIALKGRLTKAAPDWEGEIAYQTELHGVHVRKSGRGPGSLEPEETAGLDYTVLDGAGVREHLPWLYDLYVNLTDEVGHLLRQPVRVSDNLATSINVNLLRGKGARYEAHLDSTPYTLLLFVTSHPVGGGRLLMGADDRKIGIIPRAGQGIIFDGSAVPHTVEPLREDGIRITVPMVYLPARIATAVNPELDQYLLRDSDDV
jgi:hypothetical protein